MSQKIITTWTLKYHGFSASWDGEHVHISPIVPGGIGWTEWASTWVEAMRSLRRAVITA